MAIETRVLRPEEWDSWYGNLEWAFGGTPESPEERKLYRSLTEFERSLGVWDGETPVGCAGAFSFRMTLPGGGVLPVAGVTMVGVAPTHRRRGVLTSMMRRQLDDVRARGEAVAVLTASEPEIYGRFGYGVGTRCVSLDADVTRARIARLPEGVDEVRLRRVDPREALAACERVYAALVPERPGMMERRPGWEEQDLLDPEANREGCSPLVCVVAEDAAGEVVGYVRYALRSDWELSGAEGKAEVRTLDASTPAAYAALWRYVFELDLVSRVRVHRLPVDAPLLHLVNDVRRCEVRVRDSLHVRLVDVDAALAARRYRSPVDVVLDVVDGFLPENSGRRRLTGDAKGAQCAPTTDAAELRLDVRELGAAYLGGTTLRELAAAGLVTELRPGALAAASTAFAGDVAPWLPHGF
ncbi:GNAT family N-acetyltransferase [Streptomyces sp. BI20]|uniref:GNAT family N-acetyltransferase n=1 Tax=Streptomyces sp. BI20 TaxID=3403460 RepID=UPI003C71B011